MIKVIGASSAVLLIALLLANSRSVLAQTVSTGPEQITPITNVYTDFSLPVGVPQFDSSLGTLLSAQLSFTASISTSLSVYNQASSMSVGYANTIVSIGLTDPNGFLPNPAFSNSGVLTPGSLATIVNSQRVNFSLLPGASVGPITRLGSGGAAMTFDSTNNPMVLSELTGNGLIRFNASTFTQTSITSSGGNTTAAQTTTASVGGTVNYTYVPTRVPEPSPLLYALCGCTGGLGLVRRRLKRQKSPE